MSLTICSTSASAFEEEIREKFEDDTPRLIYADHLEERGERLGTYLRAFTRLWTQPDSELPEAVVEERVVVQQALSLVIRPATAKTLTPFQKRLVPFWRELYQKAGLSIGLTDRDAARTAVTKSYAVGGYPPPRLVLFVDSPAAGCITAQSLPELLTRLETQSGGQLWGRLWDRLWRQLGDRLRGQLGDQLWNQLWNQLVGQSWDQLWNQLGGQLWGHLGSQLRGRRREQMYRCGYGSHDAYWLSAYTFARHVMGLPGLEKVDGLDDMTEVGWWWPFEKVCVVSAKPTRISFDREKKLHREDGPAILYPDGYGVWARHGRRIEAH